jgi:transcriptional regulator with AAA-type ATPase domain
LGSTKSVSSRFRLLSATNFPEDRLFERLDADFLDRIGPLRLRLPPLRAITEEIEWLWPAVLREATTRARISERRRLSQVANARIVAALQRHDLPGNVRDLFGVAYRLLAVLAEPGSSESDAVEFAIGGLPMKAQTAIESVTPLNRIGAAWSTRTSLRALLPPGSQLKTTDVFADLQRYLAQEIQAVAKEQGCSAEELCDVTERTLRNWRTSGSDRKNVSE